MVAPLLCGATHTVWVGRRAIPVNRGRRRPSTRAWNITCSDWRLKPRSATVWNFTCSKPRPKWPS